MLTFFVFISTIHGWSSMRQGVARLDGSFSKLRADTAESAGCAPSLALRRPASLPRGADVWGGDGRLTSTRRNT